MTDAAGLEMITTLFWWFVGIIAFVIVTGLTAYILGFGKKEDWWLWIFIPVIMFVGLVLPFLGLAYVSIKGW